MTLRLPPALHKSPSRNRFLVSKEATWFEGIDSNHDVGISKVADDCEAFLSIGPRRYPVYPVQRLTEHYYRTQQLAGRLNSDAHNFGFKLRDFKYNKFLLSWDLEKAHAGSGAQYTGENTRNNDLVTVHCKNHPLAANKMYITMITLQILKIDSSGATVID